MRGSALPHHSISPPLPAPAVVAFGLTRAGDTRATGGAALRGRGYRRSLPRDALLCRGTAVPHPFSCARILIFFCLFFFGGEGGEGEAFASPSYARAGYGYCTYCLYAYIYACIYVYLTRFGKLCRGPRALPARPGGCLGSSRALGWKLPGRSPPLLARFPGGGMGMALRPREGRGSVPAAGGEPSRAGRPSCGSPSGGASAGGGGEGGPGAGSRPLGRSGRAARLSCRAWKGVKGGRAF